MTNKTLCDSCSHEFATCPGRNVVYAIDKDESLRGEEADVVLDCDFFDQRLISRQEFRDRVTKRFMELKFGCEPPKDIGNYCPPSTQIRALVEETYTLIEELHNGNSSTESGTYQDTGRCGDQGL